MGVERARADPHLARQFLFPPFDNLLESDDVGCLDQPLTRKMTLIDTVKSS